MIHECTGTFVVAVSSELDHLFSKSKRPWIRLVKGLGVEGDAHFGRTVQHRSRVAVDPTQPNLRQVHVLHEELFDALKGDGFSVGPGQLGENVTTRGINLLALPEGTLLQLGDEAVVKVTGLRNPCSQIDRFREGLLRKVCFHDASGGLVRLAGIMGVVESSGTVTAGDEIHLVLPEQPYRPLERV